MSVRANYFKTGLFVIIGIVIAVAAVVILGVGAILREEIMVESYFEDSVQGLDVGSPVKFRGVQIGKVDTIALVNQYYPTDRRYVLIRMALFSDVFLVEKSDNGDGLKKLIRDGLRVRLNFQGVTGAAYIEADYLEPDRYPPLVFNWEPRYPYIPSAPSIITRLSESADKIMRNLEKINLEGLIETVEKSLQAVTSVLDETNVAQIGDETEKLLSELRETNRQINSLVEKIDLEPLLKEASATVADTRQLVQDVRKPLESFLATSTEAANSVNRIVGNLESSGDLSAALSRLQNTARRLDNMVSGQQVDIETIVENFRIFSENFREVSEELSRNPRKFIFGGPPPRPESGGN